MTMTYYLKFLMQAGDLEDVASVMDAEHQVVASAHTA